MGVVGWCDVLGKLPVPGRPTIWITVGQGPTALAVGAGGGCLDIFTLIYPFSPLSPSFLETARYKLKYCLKGPLNPKQPTNQRSCVLCFPVCHVSFFNPHYYLNDMCYYNFNPLYTGRIFHCDLLDESSFLDLHLSISDSFVKTKIYDKRDNFDFDIIFRFKMMMFLIRHLMVFIFLNLFVLLDCPVRLMTLIFVIKFLQQNFSNKAIVNFVGRFSKYYRRHFYYVSKCNVGLKTFLLRGLSEPEFYGDVVYKFKIIIGKKDFSDHSVNKITDPLLLINDWSL